MDDIAMTIDNQPEFNLPKLFSLTEVKEGNPVTALVFETSTEVRKPIFKEIISSPKYPSGLYAPFLTVGLLFSQGLGSNSIIRNEVDCLMIGPVNTNLVMGDEMTLDAGIDEL
ncbi:hypothetical protein HK100_005596 [Physocladia obscura]|uniref:Uncharacterized protein n=1 Tax=Physocladia obscura TaxID=109957 RepID=A0AAD5T7I8_9FUNG|nr:hypothetical protein HK100_005596 [Physocladia obscura]